MIKLDLEVSKSVVDRAEMFFWWLEFRRCLIRQAIGINGEACTENKRSLTRVNVTENTVRFALGLPTRRLRAWPEVFNSADRSIYMWVKHAFEMLADPGSSLFPLLVSPPLPVGSKADLLEQYPELAEFVENPLEEKGWNGDDSI